MTRFVAVTLALCAALALADDEPDDGVPPKALASYNEGKAAYDRKQYAQALAAFDRCVDLDPARARWHYNRGLALKKLQRDNEAVSAFEDSRRLDPAYKRKEIDAKLYELNYAGTSSSQSLISQTGGGGALGLGLICLVMIVAVAAGVWLVVRTFGKKAADPLAESPADMGRSAKLDAAIAKLAGLQAPLEHALAPDDDPAGRALVEKAGNELQTARMAALPPRNVAAAEGAIARASAAIENATRHFATKNGPTWDQGRGERVGCFFCARPLAAKSARNGVGLTSNEGRWAVVACAGCAKKAASGGPLTVRMLGAGSQRRHWGQLDTFDPYAHGYWGGIPSEDLPAWKADLTGERLTGLATLLGAAAVGAAVSSSFDLGAAREAGLAAQAATAAATNAQRSRDTSNFRDHS
jgi:hypothetical protein